MKIVIEFNIDNEAYAGEQLATGICDTLNHLVNRMTPQCRKYLLGNGNRAYLKDSNGNTVGFATIVDIDESETEENEAAE